MQASPFAHVAGLLYLHVALPTGQFVSVADINGGKLAFTPVANANGSNYGNITFLEFDDGGTLKSVVGLDKSTNKLTIDVTSVHDAPTGADKPESTLEDTAYTLSV